MSLLRGDSLRADGRVSTGDVIEMLSAPFTLTGGHPHRRQRCVVCGMRIGGRPARTVTIQDLRGLGCHCGAIPVCTYLTCSEHASDPRTDYATPALRLYAQHHDGPVRFP